MKRIFIFSILTAVAGLLTQGAMAEMYGRMSGVKLDQTK